ncbi:hypothetical protein FQR65_LT07577 [Abscondita terminalis]|nr:hypothetical protein FQR65_LT07577 [Abscondita terminalis]
MFVYGPRICNYSSSEPSSEDESEETLLRRREECERKARRGEMDPRLEFTFQLLIDATGLSRHEIMDHVFEGNMLDEINQLFIPHAKSKLMWFYQDMEEEPQTPVDPNKPSTSRNLQSSVSRPNPVMKKKLFLTDGWEYPLTGICIYIFRLNTSKQLPEEGFHKDLYCGVIDAEKIGLVTAVERIIRHVYMEALAFPSADCEDDAANCPMVKNQLLPGLRSFCSALKVCEEVCGKANFFEDGKSVVAGLTFDQLKEMAKQPEEINFLQNRVKNWIKCLSDILKESDQIRRENDSSGPQDELEYWKKRGATFSQIVNQLQAQEVQLTITCLMFARSKVMKEWRETDEKVTFCYNEAKDNAKYIQALEKNCHSLYLDDPVKMKDSILGLLQTVRLIHSVSQFYNTSERTSALMVKITNQMIETCKEYITCRGNETIWSQDRALVKEKLTQCIVLNQVYRRTYQVVKNQPFLPDQEPFNFSENYVFGKFNAFCNRLGKIIAMFDIIHDYAELFKKRMEGLLLGEILDETVQNFEDVKAIVFGKTYDYLDQRNGDFDADFQLFLTRLEELKEEIANTIEKNFEYVWETPQGIKFLTKFEKVREKIPLQHMEDKYDRILKYCEKEISRIVTMYKKEKDDPPICRMFPPIAGRIKWSRSLVRHLSELLDNVTTHHVLKLLPAAIELIKKYKNAENMLKGYENDMVEIWMSQHVWEADNCLKKPLIAICQEQQTFKVNLHNTIPLLIREADILSKMDLPLPMIALTLYTKQDHFTLIQDSLQFLINNIGSIVRGVKLEIRPLFLPQLVRLINLLSPGLKDITWVSSEWKVFVDELNEALENFRVLVNRAHDIYTNRILEVLATMQSVSLHCLPEPYEEPWNIDYFCESTESICRSAASDLHKKSLMIEEAVEEILELVRKAQLKYPATMGDDTVFCFDDDQTDARIDIDSTSTQQPADWSLVYECFENPHLLLGGGLLKTLQDIVKGAMSEMRRFYSRKVVDVLVRVTRQSLEALRKRFSEIDEDVKTPVFILNAVLLIPKVVIQPNLDEVQEALIQVGKYITSVSKGVGQWTGGKAETPKKKSKWKKLVGHQRTLLDIVSRCTEQRSSKQGVKTKEEDFRTRRRRLYRLTTEEKPMFPFQQKNFFNNVMENKEVVKTLSLLSTCTQDMKQDVNNFLTKWRPYNVLWRNEKSQRELLNCCLTEFDSSFQKHEELDGRLSIEPDVHNIATFLAISTEKLKYALNIEIKSCTQRIGLAMKKKYRREMDYVYAVINEMGRKLDKPIRDLDDVRLIMDTLKKTREQEVDMELKIEPIEEAFNILTRYEVNVEQHVLEQVDNLRYTWTQLMAKAQKVNVHLLSMQPQFQEELRVNLAKFKQDKIDYCNEYKDAGPMEPGLAPREASDRLILFQNRFDGMWRKLQTYQSGEELFGLPTTDYPELAQIRKELNLLQKLYKLYNDVIDRVNSYYDIPWGEVNIEEINNELMEFQNRCRKLPKGLKEWPAFFALKKTIDDFNDMCPLLELMANKAMKPRHWQRIMDALKYVFELESDGFCLKNILEAPLLQHKEDIEDICISAMKERDIEAKLRQVTNEWSVHELTFMSFNNRGELLLRGDTTAETIGQLEDSLMILGSLLSNRYNAPFRKQIQQWVHDLSNTNEILERWLLVQNMWVYLEAVFVGGDIAKQLPKEAKRFSKIDKSWQKIMQRAHETPGVVSCCVGDDLLRQLLPHLQEQLELCQKSLSGYLEKKRMMFPRFFFVSDPALLEILGQASDSHTIQNHLLSIFDNTRWVKFHDIEYNKMTAVVSSENEVIPLEKAVRAEGSVETWLTQLLVTSQMSLHSIIRQAYTTINDVNFNLLMFLDKLPAQIGLLGLQMIWTRDAELALMQARADKKIMADTNNKFLELLNTLIDQTTKDLTKIERTKFETLITIHVHQRDIFDILCRLNIKHVNDFEWLKQCRFYFKEEADKTLIIITDVVFSYQNEYLGCTDRCYITLAQALSMSMGGAPCGPAGTGKTETVKDMGKTLAKYVVVFNCSDQMDYRGLGRIYKGLAQSGSWGCFDEFNRIELPVLSVAAQQVAVVLSAKKEKKKTFVFTDGDTVELCPEFGVFITMNPGYAGRKELPENLKIQFRTVAMMVPDRQIIIRVKLASCGFLENITLARKFYTLYKLCEEQLTKQVHYDFGLRNILSVLRTLGASKRVNQKDSESTIVMRVLRDMNLSKLIDEDEPLFNSLVSDLFPTQTLEKTVYPELEEAINVQVEEAGLVNHSSWQIKLIQVFYFQHYHLTDVIFQLYETQRVRHGIMTLGPTGAGKTTCIHTLMKALTQLGKSHREMRMNPKAITAAQMFGRLDVATNDWTDGIFSALWRKTLKLRDGEYVWLVLDGPVDSIWIENLNSVLDDNKTLTLANGDRLSMAPTCKIIFEPHNIDNASPATVSRNGMVYMSSSGLTWKPVVKAWLKKRSTREQEVFYKLFRDSFNTIYSWVSQNLVLVMNVLQCNVTLQILNLLEGLVPSPVDEIEDMSASKSDHGDLDDEPAEEPCKNEVETFSEQHLRKIYVFGLTWGLGSLLETKDRVKFDHFLKDKLAELDLPVNNLKNPDATVFDYVVNDNGDWELWTKRVTNYVYPEMATPDYANILIPITDNVRIDYLINVIAKQEKGVLLIGEQGSAKTVMIKAYMKKTNPEVYLIRSFNFSSATSPYQFQKTMESYVEKRMGNTFGPPGGKKLMVFIDDANLPEINCWGDQITNEILRQTMDMNGFYSLEKPGEFTQIVDVQFVAAMGHPGGGRNDIPSRLKRHFCIFNCPLPTDASIDKIFGVIGQGHYNIKRGFSLEVRNLIKNLIPLTRKLWSATRAKLLPTPAKFHYVFSLRDLSRIWQGMVGTLSTVIESESCLMILWKHECTRVFSDRFTIVEDKVWFDENILSMIEHELGLQYRTMSLPNPVFVDFMRDAPEPTGEEGEDADMELPKVYEPVNDDAELRERLEMFLAQFNEMVRGSGMDLVFFPDAMLHLVKISRVIRHPRGNVMLVGVGGSGKQSLTKLSTFIAGYKSFQITLTRSYNIANFLEDIKALYRSCGCQAKGTTFIFTDLDIKEEGFLEYLNNILSSGVISNLFTKDEQAEIVQELTPIMRRENPKRTLNQELVMEYFMNRTCQNLHVVLCFSPVGEKFRNRAMRFPALISGCTLDWFQPWPKDALVSVAKHFLSSFDITCTEPVKLQLVEALGSIQDIVTETSIEYFQRFRRATHVTPKSYLNFIAGYKSIYQNKREELSEGALRMDTGLEKLAEASASVEILKKELAVMKKELADASQRAERVLTEVQIVKEKAEILVSSIAHEKALAEEKLEAAKPALEEAEAALNTIKPAHIATVRKLGRPPHLIMRIMDCVLILFQRKLLPVTTDASAPSPKPSWPDSLKVSEKMISAQTEIKYSADAWI